MYISTRNNFGKVTAAQAIKLGMVPKGGLFIPEALPKLNMDELESLVGKSYQEIAYKILSLFLDDYTSEEIKECITNAYNKNFDNPEIAPLHKLNDGTYILELWHGPTAAFKDMALQIMPYLLSKAIQKQDSSREVVILVATSGDTGKAALEGFKNVPGIKIITYYPLGGVSKVQELQMTTTEGDNTYAVAVKGNFDDCQSAVKEIFSDNQFKAELLEQGYELSSANSINWGRLSPQIVYYFSTYSNLVAKGDIKLGDKVNFVVPTGNFGNILAAYYALRMGLPIGKLICASNENNVLTDFFKTGTYDRVREFKRTTSPSMDILISSNLERFLAELNGHDGDRINQWMKELNTKGEFSVDEEIKAAMAVLIYADFADEQATAETIKDVFENDQYTLDTHTAVAVKVYNNYVAATGDKTTTVIDATASPYKFVTSVMAAIKGEEATTGKDELKLLDELSEISGMEIHPGLKDLDKKRVKHFAIAEKEHIKMTVEKILNLK
jgi:threonine synthase